MENNYEQVNEGFFGRFRIRSEAALNMAGVVLFYVVVFVAFSVFSN